MLKLITYMFNRLWSLHWTCWIFQRTPKMGPLQYNASFSFHAYVKIPYKFWLDLYMYMFGALIHNLLLIDIRTRWLQDNWETNIPNRPIREMKKNGTIHQAFILNIESTIIVVLKEILYSRLMQMSELSFVQPLI